MVNAFKNKETKSPIGDLVSAGAPLADRMRPETLDDFLGQDEIVGEGKLLKQAIEGDNLPSMIFWGPPGSGKTTLAHIIAKQTKSDFVRFSAVTSGVADLRNVIKKAENNNPPNLLLSRCGGDYQGGNNDEKSPRFPFTKGGNNNKGGNNKRTILFIDEIHRWNKSQQDALLPHIENGAIILIGATTENPSFEVRGALLSRCRVFVLKQLDKTQIADIIYRALKDEKKGLGKLKIKIDKKVIGVLAEMSNGDARVALNVLEYAAKAPQTQFVNKGMIKNPPTPFIKGALKRPLEVSPLIKGVGGIEAGCGDYKNGLYAITLEIIKDAFQKPHLFYDKGGDEHYNIISALHKSIRGSDESAALYWLARMLEAGEDPLYIARRLVRFASEDVGLANSRALEQAVASFRACQFIGMPECNVILAQTVVYLSKCKKSNDLYTAYGKAAQDAREYGNLPVPAHIRNAPTKLMKDLGYGKDYKYSPDYDYGEKQEYMPDKLKKRKYFK